VKAKDQSMNTNMSDKNQWRFMEKHMSSMELSVQMLKRLSARWRRGGAQRSRRVYNRVSQSEHHRHGGPDDSPLWELFHAL